MTKKEIVRTISEAIGLTQVQTKQMVQTTFDAIVDVIVTERRIELRNFGVFEVKQRSPRTARNPKTGKKVLVPARYVVMFKPGKEMEARVREVEERDARVRRWNERDQVHANPETPPVPAFTNIVDPVEPKRKKGKPKTPPNPPAP